MTLTLDIPADLNDTQRERLARTLYEVRAVSAEQAAALVGLSLSQFLSSLARSGDDAPRAGNADEDPSTGEVRQGSPEWRALLRRPGPAHGVILPLEATSREAIYEDDMQ